MKKAGQLYKRVLSVLLALILGLCLALTGYVPEAKAAEGTTEIYIWFQATRICAAQ